MSDRNDDRNAPSGANYLPGEDGRRGDPGIRERAGVDVRQAHSDANGYYRDYADDISRMTSEGRSNVDYQIRRGSDDMRKEQSSQKASRRFREQRAQIEMYEQVLSHPDLKLGDVPFNGPAEISSIQDRASDAVAQSEQKFLDKIDRETRYAIEREIGVDHDRRSRERSGQTQQSAQPERGQEPDYDHDQEPEH